MRYLSSMVNYRNTPEDRARADTIALTDLIERWDHEDGTITINYLQFSPVQCGQHPWIGRDG